MSASIPSHNYEEVELASPLTSYLAHIANGATVSSEAGVTNGGLNIGGNGLTRVLMPAAFTGATLTFQVSPDDGTYLPLYNADGTAYSVAVAASRAVVLDPSVFIGVNYIKIVSNLAEGGARVVTLVGRAL